MYYSKFIRFFYLGLTILALLCPVKISFINLLPGLLLMWFFYAMFSTGITRNSLNVSPNINLVTFTNSKIFLFFLIFVFPLFYSIYIKYYTGLNVIVALKNVFSGYSNYYLYQEYFKETQLSSFSINKLPFILGNGLLRYLFLIIVFKCVIFKHRITKLEYTTILFSGLSIFVVSLARGTSFELFELFIIITYAIAARISINTKNNAFRKKYIFKALIVILIITIYFTYNISKRMGSDFDFTYLPDFDNEALIVQFSKPISILLYALYGYFLFGIHFTSTAIIELLNSLSGLLSIFVPKGIQLFEIDSGIREYVGKFIDLGAKWTPDTSAFLESLGLILLTLIIYYIGKFSIRQYQSMFTNIHSSILLFYIFYSMISLPIGNFVVVSSGNIICLFLSLTLSKIRLKNQILK